MKFFKWVASAALSLFIVTLGRNALARTMAEALGFSPEQKILLVHADDLGSLSAANAAAADLFRSGLVTSGSVMMDGVAVPEIIQYAKEHPTADLGVHLTLTSEWKYFRWGPVSSPSQVPSVVDHDGDFLSGLLPLFIWGRQADVSREMDAQIRKAIALGLNPSHIDTHMGSVFLHPSWFKAYLHLARVYQLPPMVPRWSAELKQSFFGSFGGKLMDLLGESGLFSAKSILNSVEQDGFLLIDHLYMFPKPVSTDNSFEKRKAFYVHMIENLKPGVSQIIIHPAYDTGRFSQILESDSNQVLRNYEARIFQDPDVIEAARQAHVTLITWRDVGRAYEWSQVQDLK